MRVSERYLRQLRDVPLSRHGDYSRVAIPTRKNLRACRRPDDEVAR